MQCIYCGTAKDLNTSMTVTLDDGVKHTVNICDEHAEDASIKSVKEAFIAKQAQIQAVLEQAKALGLNISDVGGITVAQAEPAPPSAPPSPSAPQGQPTAKEQPELGDDFIPTDMIDKDRTITSVGGNTDMGNVASYQSYDISGTRGDLPDDVLKGKVKMEVMEGREGQPLAVPQQRVDGTGTTNININRSENDGRLQERFKKMAASSMGDQTPDFARAGYSNTTATCPICRGDGTVKMGAKSQMCPKCDGSGIISTS